MRIGVIADTHGLLEARVLQVFQGVEAILHAGDVGTAEVLEELSALAPVTAVLGNNDGFPLAHRLRDVEVADLGGVRFLILHQVGKPQNPDEEVRRLVLLHRPAVVVFGHTHAPFDQVQEGVRFFNPGGSGPRRFGLPRTVALLEVSPSGVAARFVDLDATSPDPRERSLA